MIRKMWQRRRIDDEGIPNDGRLTSFIYKINISDGKLTPVGGRFAVGISAHILCHISGAGSSCQDEKMVIAVSNYIFFGERSDLSRILQNKRTVFRACLHENEYCERQIHRARSVRCKTSEQPQKQFLKKN